mmetsp:Transcript_23855/g.57521  ORF Transcript_23855/g.57521 Transcript_23855/m.57521 type:complete len:177 (-) Transcript_23855:70-600(-)
MGVPSVSDCGVGVQRALPHSDDHGPVTNPATTLNQLDECDACPYCRDTCENTESCVSCQKKNLQCRGPANNSWFMDALYCICSNPHSQENRQSRTYTMCQLRRHNHANSAWILVGNTIYDATPYIRSHPGGMEAILRKSGGAVDCTEDLHFHSKRAQKEWRRFKIGTLCPCPSDYQ